MPKKMLADVDDVVQIRSAWAEMVNLAQSLGWDREEIAGVVQAWVEKLIDRE